MTWEDWNGNFLHYFGEEPVMYGTEEDWKLVAKNISQLTTFESYPVPDPDAFTTWQEWASALSFILNGPSV
jgi:hypothetical protein